MKATLNLSLLFVLQLLCGALSAQSNIDSLELEAKKKLKPNIQTAVTIQLGRLRNAYGLDGAEILLRKGLHDAIQLKDSIQIAKAYETLGILKEREGNLDIAMALADSTKAIITLTKDTFRNFTLQLLYGELYRRKAKYAEALQHYMESAHTAEILNNDDLKSKAYNALGIFYVNTKNYTDALKFHNKALALNEKLNNTMTIMNSLGNLGIVYRELQQFDKALELHKKALAIVLKTKDSSEISYQLHAIGVDYLSMKNIPKAIENIKAAIALRERMNETSEIAYSYGNLAHCYKEIKDYTNAELYFKKAISTSKNIDNKRQLSDNYLALSQLYETIHIPDSAYTYSKLYNTMRDSLLEEDNQGMIQELTVQYHTKEQALQIKDQQLTIKRRNNLIYTVIAITAALAFSFYSRMKRKKTEYASQLKDAEIAAQQKAAEGIIEAEENERQRLAAEIHDGVGQMLNVAKIKINETLEQIKKENSQTTAMLSSASDLVYDGIQELRTITHNITPPALLKNGLIEALQKFAQKIDTNTTAVHLFHEGWNTPIPKNTEIVLYRIVQESINNILKHAKASQINITAIKEAQCIDISIEDNGIGFDTQLIQHGLGLMNIEKRVAYLKGEIDINSSPGNGTSIMIHIPV